MMIIGNGLPDDIKYFIDSGADDVIGIIIILILIVVIFIAVIVIYSETSDYSKTIGLYIKIINTM